MKYKRLFTMLSAAIISAMLFLHITRCTPLTEPQRARQITLVSYNAQTFFDAVEDGTEFQEFKGSKTRWTEQKYRARLERLKQTLFTAGEKLTGKKERLPDIVVMQEIENERIIEDLCKQLPNRETYPYAMCPPRSPRDAFTVVLLSKYPIENFRVHHLYMEGNHSVRPLVEAELNTGSKAQPRILTVFAVHWKSKSGSTESASIRAMQEEQLIKKIHEHTVKNPHIPFIVCGDFNQPLEEFRRMNEMTVCWNMPSYKNEVMNGTQPSGSYFFKDTWEKIDHIFYDNGTVPAAFRATAAQADASADAFSDIFDEDMSDITGNMDEMEAPSRSTETANSSTVRAGAVYIEPTAFFVLNEPPLTQDGKPARYNVLTGEGYSDHLPLGFRFEIRN